jgi:hypothetical protein
LLGVRAIPEFGAVNRTQGLTLMVTLGYQAKLLVKGAVIHGGTQVVFCVRTFMKRPVKLLAQFERSTSLSDTLPVSARRRSGSDTDERERVQQPAIVKRLSLARRGGSPFYARSVLKALCGTGA